MSYDNWKTTDPRDSRFSLELDVGQSLCPFCDGEGHGRDEDGPWFCSHCKGKGVVWDDEMADLVCPRCGCEDCDCVAVEAMLTEKEAA